MSRLRVLLGTTAIVAVGMLVGSLIPAASQEAGSALSTFKACEYNAKGFDHEIDVDDDGELSSGDYSVFEENLYEPGSGDKIGRDLGTFTFIRPLGREDGVFHVTITFTFPEGRIATQGGAKFSNLGDGINLPITGGTRGYRNARGEIQVQEGRCNDKRALKLRFEVEA